MKKIKLTLACHDYDRTRALWDGSVSVEGIDLVVLLLPVEEIFSRMVRYQEFDISEMGMSSFLISQSGDEPPFVGIPVFPSRKFRHADIYIRKDSQIKSPEDLRGGRIGLPEYHITAAVWVRGILEEFFNVPTKGVNWFTGGTERPRREERPQITLPPGFKIRTIAQDTTLLQLLREGELDAIITARVPSPFIQGESWIVRLFPNSKDVEIDYFQKTGIFPIMHTVVFRRDIYEKYPWAARALYKAFCEAKDLCFRRMIDTAALTVSLPWFNTELEDSLSLMGRDFWCYGLEANKKTISKLVQYMGQQGLLPEGFNPEAETLFAKSTLHPLEI